jgi:hypothetical protein
MQRTKDGSQAHRDYARLLRLHEGLLTQLQKVAAELVAPGTQSLVREFKRSTGEAENSIAEVTSAVEEAIRTLKDSGSRLRVALIKESEEPGIEGAPNLPAVLARFLAERKGRPEFTFEIVQDEVRGWIIRWKEMHHTGTVRGFGQFYERPYAWLEE